MKKNVPVLRGINDSGLLPLLPEKAPPCVDEKAISLCNRTVRTRDQRQQASGSGGSEGLLVSGLGRALFTERSPPFSQRREAGDCSLGLGFFLTAGSGSWQQQGKRTKGA